MTVIRKQKVEEFLEDLASTKPAPGGGSVAAVTGAIAAALVVTVAAKKLQMRLLLSQAAFQDAKANVLVNLPYLKDNKRTLVLDRKLSRQKFSDTLYFILILIVSLTPSR